MAEELAAPFQQQLLEMFGPNTQGSPGDINNPALVLAVVHKLAKENAVRVDFLQVGNTVEFAYLGAWDPGMAFAQRCAEQKLTIRRQQLGNCTANITPRTSCCEHRTALVVLPTGDSARP
jgi:hypothetical protein